MYDVTEHSHLGYRKMVWCDKEDYSAELEYFEGEVFVHIDVYNFSPSVLKDIRKEHNVLKGLAKSEGFEYIYSYNPNLKFSKLVEEYEDIGSIMWENKEVKVIRWAV